MPEVQEKELHGNRTKSKPTSPFDSRWLSEDEFDNIRSTCTDRNSDKNSESLEVAAQKPPEFRDVSERVGASLVQSDCPNRHWSSNVTLVEILTKKAFDVSYYRANNIVGR
jgi:hypothetical protein